MNRARIARVAGGLALGLFVLFLVVLSGVRLVYGGGRVYPDTSTPPVLGPGHVETLVELDLPPGNVTRSRDGRIFFNLHPFGEPQRFTDTFVYELVDGVPRAYPDVALQPELLGTLGMTVDAQNRLWLIRAAGIEDRTTRLFGFDLSTNTPVVDYEFEEGTAPFAQDLRVSPDGRIVYLADTGIFRFTPPALIVFDIEARSARRVLEGHPALSPQDWVIQSIDGPHTMGYGLVTFSVGVDGIAVSHDGAWLYFATMSHDTAYRIRTRDLNDASLSDAVLGGRIERVGPKPLSDGIAIDAENNLYLTDVEHGSIARLAPDGTLSTYVHDDRVVWADGIDLSPDGSMLFTDSAIPSYLDPFARPPSRERLARRAPHRIYRVTP